ncbi:MAG: glutamate--tRNA ligase [Candidatus Sumerlaeota bacterium]
MTPEKTVRTRIAPSPTGDPHIGTAYQALFDYCFAKSRGGKFVLRIEDTDQARSTPESEAAILNSLKWLGIEWDEGPEAGGPHGPYRQSERTEIYREHCQKLLEGGKAYRCFCTPEELAEARQNPRTEHAEGGYDKFCAQLSEEEVKKKMGEGLPFTVRLKVPTEGECVLKDRLRGEIKTAWKTVDDQVLMKSDNFPTYHLASVVDDHLMEITHVLRGEEWISSGPKHLLLYEAFGWEPPEFIHLPLLRNPDKSKLSKRKNPTSIFYYRQAGILPEALVNYLGLMGYTLPSGEELFSVDEMVESFDIDRVSLGGPIFDVEKLKWLNGRYLRETLDSEQLLLKLKDWMLNDAMWKQILPLAQPRLEAMSDLVPLTAFFFDDKLDYDPQLLIPKKLEGDEVGRLLRILLWELEGMRQWDKDFLHSTVRKISENEDVKIRDLVAPLFVAITGSQSSTPLFDSMEILGPDMSRRRIHYALEALAEIGHDMGKKKLKKLEKDYRERY